MIRKGQSELGCIVGARFTCRYIDDADSYIDVILAVTVADAAPDTDADNAADTDNADNADAKADYYADVMFRQSGSPTATATASATATKPTIKTTIAP